MRNKKRFNLAYAMGILQVDRDKLFYWISRRKLIKPVVQGRGRGGRTFLSIDNLLDLALIKEFVAWGFDLNAVDNILSQTKDRWDALREIRGKGGWPDDLMLQVWRPSDGGPFAFLSITPGPNSKPWYSDKYEKEFHKRFPMVKEKLSEIFQLGILTIPIGGIAISIEEKAQIKL